MKKVKLHLYNVQNAIHFVIIKRWAQRLIILLNSPIIQIISSTLISLSFSSLSFNYYRRLINDKNSQISVIKFMKCTRLNIIKHRKIKASLIKYFLLYIYLLEICLS